MVQRRSTALALALALVLVGTAAGVAAARPPPQSLCVVCTDQVLAEDAVENATVRVALDPNGTGHWRVTYDLAPGVEVDSERLRTAVGDALEPHRGEAPPRNHEVTVAGSEAVVTYAVPGMGHRTPGGALVVDYLYGHGESGRYYGVNADRIALVAPADSTVAHAPPGVETRPDAVVLRGEYAAATDNVLRPGGYVAFAPPGVLGVLAATVGVGVDVALAKAEDLPAVVALPTVVLGLFVVLALRAGERLAALARWKRALAVAGLTVGLGVVAAVGAAAVGSLVGSGPFVEQVRRSVAAMLFVSVFVGSQSLVGAVGGVGLQYLAVSAGKVDAETVVRWTARAGVAAVLLAVPLVGTAAWPARSFGTVVGLLVPLAFLPLAVADDRRRRLLLGAVILAGPTLVGIAFAPYGGFGQRFAPVVLVPWALAAGAVGLAGYVAGLALARQGGPE